MDVIEHLAKNNERIWNLYQIGPVQRAEIESFALDIVQECIRLVQPSQHHEAFPDDYIASFEGIDLLHAKVVDIKKHFETTNDVR